jgi:hypothetical protein
LISLKEISFNIVGHGMDLIVEVFCHNLNLGLATKTKACESAGQEWTWESHFMFSKVQESWKNEPPHSQVNSHFGSWSPNRFLNLQKVIVGVKTHWIEEIFISLESSWNIDVKMGSHDPFRHFKHKLWPKKGR